MRGKYFVIGLLVFLVIFGAGLFYSINYAHYTYEKRNFITLSNGGAAFFTMNEVELLDAKTSPIKYRACGVVNLSQTGLDQMFERAREATPLVAPKWFDCFDAGQLTAGIASGEYIPYLYLSNEPWGVDTILLYRPTGSKGYLWRQLNACGEAKFSGDDLPPNCSEEKEQKNER